MKKNLHKNKFIKKNKYIEQKFNNIDIIFNQTFNTFLITILSSNKKILCWSSSGSVGFSGKKKISHSAIELIAKDLIKKILIKFKQLKKIEYNLIIYTWITPYIRTFLKFFKSIGLKLNTIIFLYKKGHNGIRPKKKRRI